MATDPDDILTQYNVAYPKFGETDAAFDSLRAAAAVPRD